MNVNSLAFITRKLSNYERGTHLVVRINQRLCKNDVLSSGSRKDDNLGNVIRRKRIAAAIDEHVKSM